MKASTAVYAEEQEEWNNPGGIIAIIFLFRILCVHIKVMKFQIFHFFPTNLAITSLFVI